MRPRLIARWLRGRPAEAGEPVPDVELLARFAGAGDEAAFELLVWRHAALVLGVCRRVVRDDHLAEDAFQAAFLVLARKAGSVRGANLAGWLFRVARRVSARARRQAEARARRETPLSADVPDAPLPCPAEDRESLAILDEEVARLPERFRRPVLLCYLGGRSTEDAARVLGCPRGTVLSRLATARQRLAARLTRRGVTLPAGVLGTVAVPSVSGVVPPAVRASLTFLAAGSRLTSTNPILLANGALTAMKLGNTLSAGAVLLVAAGLFGGYSLVVRPGGEGMAVAAAEPQKANPPEAKRKPADPPNKAEPDPTAERRDAELQRLDELQLIGEGLRREIEDIQRHIDQVQAVVGHDLELIRLRANLASRSFELDRELLVDEVRELAKRERDARRALRETEESNPDTEDGRRRVAGLRAVAQKAGEELLKAKREVKKLEEEQAHQFERQAEREHELRTKVEMLNGQLRAKQGEVEKMKATRQQAELRLRGVERSTPGTDSNLMSDLLKEVRELRREVQELKRK